MGSQPEESPESSDLLEDSPADPLARLGHTLDTLRRDAEGLAHEIDAETGPASEMRLALAESIMPLSAKDGGATPRELYLEGLRRRRLRLQREGEAIAEQLARLNAESQRLYAKRAELDEVVSQLRARGASALANLDEIHAHRARMLAWAQASVQQHRRLLEWSERLAVHARRLRDFPPESAPTGR